MTTFKTFTEADQQALQEILADDLRYISSFMEIPDKLRQRRKFNPWPVQRKLVNGLTGRDIVVKDAQIGCTSIITGLFLKHTMTTPDTTTVIVSHEEFLTQRLLHRAQVFYDSVPTQLKPPMDHSSSYEKRFPDINSIMYIGTARSQVFGRGEPIHRLLLSEEAFYVPGAYERIILPALQRVPPDGMVVRESTPNGESGSFFDEIQIALEGRSAFTLHTLYWWENPDNQLPKNSGIAIRLNLDAAPLSDEERALLLRVPDLTQQQMRWRRWKVMEMGPLFQQEHLEDLDQCFLTVGAPHYDAELTLALTKGCFPAPHTGPEGSKIWYQPEEGGWYTMGIDPGEGKQSESVAHIWRHDLGYPRHEAALSGYYEPAPMAEKCMALGKYYGSPLAIPEANSHGLALVGPMLKSYPRMYYRRDLVRGVSTLKAGWLTTPSTKPFMMQEMVSQLHRLVTHDAEFVRQLRGFRDLGMGKVATVVADDHHDAGCLSLVGAIGYSPGGTSGFQNTSGWDW